LVSAETDGILYYIPWSRASLFQIEPFHGPGYAAAIKLVSLFQHDPFAAAKLVSILAGGMFLVSAWFLIRSIGTLAQSVCATTLLALSPVVLQYSNMIMSDMLAASLFLNGCALLIVPARPRRINWLIAGCCCGGAYLTRYPYITALVLPPLALLLYADAQPRRRKIRRALLFYGGFLCVALPWMCWLYQQKGNPFWSENYLNVAFNLHGYEGGWNNFPTSEQFKGMGDVVARDPLLFARSWIRTAFVDIPRTLCNLIPGTGPGIVLCGILVFLLNMSRRRAVLVGVVCSYWCALAVVWVDDRYLLPIVPIICFAVTDMVFAISVRLEKLPILSRRGLPVGIFIVLPLLVVEGAHCRPGQFAHLFSGMAPEYQTAARWIAGEHRPNTTVMAAKPLIPYLSGTKYINFRALGVQRATLGDFGRIVQEAQPTFVVFDEIYGSVQFPLLRPLLDPSIQTPVGNLRPVFTVDSPRRLVVYEFIGNRGIAPAIAPASMFDWEPKS